MARKSKTTTSTTEPQIERQNPMTDTPDFSALLNVNANDIKPPVPLPVGTYTFVIKSYEKGQSSKGTPSLVFKASPLSAADDVDQEQLQEATASKALGDYEMRLTYYVTPDSLWRLLDFFKSLGMDTDGRTLMELLAEAQGQSFNGYVEHQVSQKNPDQVFANIKSIAAV